jgi:hypothetical protein
MHVYEVARYEILALVETPGLLIIPYGNYKSRQASKSDQLPTFERKQVLIEFFLITVKKVKITITVWSMFSDLIVVLR